MWQIWLIASGIFFICEIITVGFLVFWLGVGALIAMLVSFFTSNIIIQMSVFVVSSGLLIFATRPLVNKISKKDVVPTNVYSLIGKKAVVTEDIDWVTGKGQIKFEGEIWSAKSKEQINIPAGSEVEIVSIEGVKAFVKPLKINSNVEA
ncbi:nodulation efficiency protein D [Clostridium sp. CAG:269]|nr:nodulation efficiency protein D [Clostridium sp. CAG:269]